MMMTSERNVHINAQCTVVDTCALMSEFVHFPNLNDEETMNLQSVFFWSYLRNVSFCVSLETCLTIIDKIIAHVASHPKIVFKNCSEQRSPVRKLLSQSYECLVTCGFPYANAEYIFVLSQFSMWMIPRLSLKSHFPYEHLHKQFLSQIIMNRLLFFIIL